MARAIASVLGNAAQQIAVYPGPGIIMTDADDVFQQKVVQNMVPVVVEALGSKQGRPRPAQQTLDDGYPERDHIVFSGDYDAMQEYFLEQGWSDGLPIVPPTLERVDRFLRHTRRDRDEVLGVLLPEQREATVWNVAVNGVMSGCRPEYMPLLLTIVEAIADPAFHIQDAGSTPGWEPLITVSGPIVEALRFNYKQGAMRVGRQANSSIGRFARLYMRNVAGFRIPPGTTDAAAIGYTFNVALAELDWAADLVGWPTTREELGFDREDDIVLVQGVRSMTPPIYTMGSTPEEHLDALAEAAYGTLSLSVHRAYTSGRQYPLILMNPPVAKVFAKAGLGRANVRDYLARNCWVPLRITTRWAQSGGLSPHTTPLKDAAATFAITASRHNGEPSLPLFIRPDDILIVVGGNPGRNQSRMYFDNAPQGSRVIRQIRS